jgi:hypothetical protein
VTDYIDEPLPIADLVEPLYDREMTLADRFEMFHRANPHVADALEMLATQWFAAGNKRASVDALFHRLRWESGITTQGDPYVLNSSYTAFYARLLIARRPEWSSAFALRKSAADTT